MHHLNPPQAVLFDLDGTLIDRRASIEAYADQFMADFASELITTDIGQVVEVLIRADGHGYRSAERPITIATKLLKGITAPLADAHWRKHFPGLAVPARSAEQAITKLLGRDIPIGLITNGSVAAQTAKLTALGWLEAFPAPIISGNYAFKKPDRRIFELGISQTGAPANETWFVGDHPVNDVWGAEQVGMHGILVPGGPPWPANHSACGFEIESLAGLLGHLDR